MGAKLRSESLVHAPSITKVMKADSKCDIVLAVPKKETAYHCCNNLPNQLFNVKLFSAISVSVYQESSKAQQHPKRTSARKPGRVR